MAALEPNQRRPLEICRSNTLSFLQDRPKPRDMKNLLLVVAALVAATTFQAAVNPPGGVWQQEKVINGIDCVGKSILASNSNARAYRIFIFFNSLAFSSSTIVIVSLIYGFPYFLETYLALFSMAATYGAAVTAVGPPDVDPTRQYFWLALLLPCLVSSLPRLMIRKYRNQGGDE